MVQCELCGSETAAPRTIKVEGAELDVCDACASHGSEIKQTTSEETTTKYSTDSTPTSTTSPGKPATRGGPSRGGGPSRRDDPFDSLGDLAQDYDDRIRQAREDRGMSQTELADQLNEKRSVIRRLERAETLPSDAMQRKLERFLEIDLSGGTVEEAEWQSDADATTFTLGEVAERKD